ncbi:potassium channel protein [Mariprofundus erugo]|uniref:Potassium channel protein n=1 Tax=Mariprofundus erugo TaxID=2528639 RepID=A0A5R9GKY0_9PROT|nr:ion transporter [Mariprofundus erugo]TLS66780.1 potassium channel protein [Mariprofundus erugo]
MEPDRHRVEDAFAGYAFRSRLQQQLNRMLFDIADPLGRRTNLTITAMIIISVLISMAGTLKGLDELWVRRISTLEMWVTILFTIELIGRCYAARSMRAYLFSFYGMVDLLAVVPMLLVGDPNLAIRLLRIVRLLKLVRYLRAMRLFIASMRDTLEILVMVIGSIALGAILAGNVIYSLEPETFTSAYDGAWWGIVTMTTVGYGDMVPHTLAGRAIAICLMVVGICMFAAVTGVVSVKVARAIHHGVKCHECGRAIAPEFPYCPYCRADQAEADRSSQEWL